MPVRSRVVVLGAGFGGLELTTILSDAFGDAIDSVLIDRSEAFVFSFSKLDVMFGRWMPADVFHPYRDIVKPGVRFLQSTVRSIDLAARRASSRLRSSRSSAEGRHPRPTRERVPAMSSSDTTWSGALTWTF